MEDKRKILYNQLSKDYDLGDFDSFSSKLDDENKRKAFYDAVSKDYDLGDYDSFVSKISAYPQPDNVSSGGVGTQEEADSIFDANMERFQNGQPIQRASVGKSDITQGSYQYKPEVQKRILENKPDMFKPKTVDMYGTHDKDKGVAGLMNEGRSYELRNMRAMGTIGEQLDERIKANDEALKSAYAKRDANKEHKPRFVFGAGSSVAPRVNTDKEDEDIANLLAEQEYLGNAKKIFDAAKNEAGFFQGMKDAVDSSWITFGVSELHNAERIANVQKKIESGQELSESEQSLLTSLGLQQIVNEQYNDLLGSWYKAGMTTTDMVPFMAEMAVNPLSGFGRAAMKASIKKFGEKGTKAVAAKILSRTIGDVAGAAGMATTTGLPSVMADALERQQGYVTTDYKGGAIRGTGLEGGENASDAWRKAITSRTIENWSEMVGNYFAPIGNAAGKVATKTLNSLKLGKVNEIIDNINSSNLARILDDFTDQTQWNGSLGEFAEEQVGMIADALLVGDTKWSDITDLDQQLDVALGVGVFGTFMSLLRIGGYRTPKYRARKAVERADENGLNLFGADWENVKGLILASPDEELSANLAAHTEFSSEQMKAAFMYANSLKAQQAVNTYKEKEKIDKPSDVGVEIEYAYDEGYELETPYDKHNAKLAVDRAEAALGTTSENADEQQFAQMVMAGADSPVESINAMAEQGYSDEQIQRAKDYYTALHRMNGLTDALLEDVDSQIERANNEVDANTNKETGSVTQVVLRNGGVGYVVQGTVVRGEKGSVDVNNSDDVIWVRLESGEIKMMNPNQDLVGVAWIESPETLKENNNTFIREGLIDKAIGEIDFNPATPNPRVGDSFEMDGVPVTIVSHNGKGGMFVVPTEEYQAAVGSEKKMQELVAKAQQTQPVPANVYKDWASAQLDAQEEAANVQQEVASGESVGEEVNSGVNDEVNTETQQAVTENRPMTEDEAASFIFQMERNAVEAPEIELTPENWITEFGEDGLVETPIGQVKFGQNQYIKLQQQGRNGKLGMIKPTLTNPDIIVEDESKAKGGDRAERATSYVFIKAFTGKDGKRMYYFTSVTIKKDGSEVVISNQEKSINKISRLLQNGNVVWTNSSFSSHPTTQVEKSVPLSDSNRLTSTDNQPAWLGINSPEHSENKDKSNNVQSQENQGDFVSMGKEKAFEVLGNKYGEKMPRKVEVTAKALAEDLRKAQQKLDKAEEDYDNAPIGREQKAEKARDKAREEFEAVKREAEFWAEMDAEIKAAQEIRDAMLNPKVEFDESNEPMTADEFISQQLANGNITLEADSYKKETGFGENERNKFIKMFRTLENGGMTIERAGEMLMQMDRENGTNFFDQNDANAGRDALINFLGSVTSWGDVTGYIRKNREAQAAKEAEGLRREMEDFVQENFHMTLEEYATLVAFERNANPYEGVDVAQIDAIFAEAELERQQLNNKEYESGTITEGNQGQSELLSEEQVGDTTGNQLGEGTEQAEGFGSGTQDESDASQESTSGSEVISQIEQARAEVDTNPTEAQKEAGNYKKGHVKIDGYDITIENPKGGVRSGTDKNGKKWSITMNNDYGYIRGTEAVDGDHIDVFLSDNPTEGNVFVVDQSNEDGSFDESKVMYGFNSLEEARAAYLSNYGEGWESRIMAITEVSKDEFKKWIDSSHRKTKAFSEYRSVKTEAGQGYSIEASNVSRMDDIEARITEIENEKIDIEGELEILGNSNPLASAELIAQLDQLDREQAELEAEYSGLRSMNDESNAILEEEGSDLRFRGQQAKEEKRRIPLRKRANEWSKKLGVKVKIMESLKDVANASARRAIIMGETVTGWYEESTGEVCLYMPYLSSESEVDATYIHEVVAHKGLRGLLGEKFDEFCDEVWEMMSASDKAKYIKYPGVNGDTRAAADEYIAHLAETIDVSDSAWSKFTELIKKFLKAIGLEPKMTNADIANTIKLSYQRLAGNSNGENVGWEGTRFRFSKTSQEFDAIQKEAVKKKGIVMPGLNEAVVDVLGIDKHNFNGNLKQAREEAKQWATENYQGKEFALPDDGGSYTIGKKAINKYVDKDSIDKSENAMIHLSALKVLPQIISSSVTGEIHADYKKGENGQRSIDNGIGDKGLLVHRMFGAIELDGKVYRVKTTMNEYRDPKANNTPHSYEVTEIELIESSSTPSLKDDSKPLNVSNNSITSAKLLNGVEKSYDKGKKLLDESEKTRFRTVYHGSGTSFDKFDHSFMSTGEGNQSYGWGTYVTEAEGVGVRYANAAQRNNINWNLMDAEDNVREDERYIRDTQKELDEVNSITKFENPSQKARVLYLREKLSNKLAEYKDQLTKDKAELEKWGEMANEKGGRHLYQVDIPDNNGSNYLSYKTDNSQEVIDKVNNAYRNLLLQRGVEEEDINLDFAPFGRGVSGETIYNTFSRELGGDKAASEFLNRNGFVGIVYPVNEKKGGNTSNENNYVIFNENDLKIVEHTRFRAVKDKNELVAVHNISEDDLRKVLSAGSLIMPSIAITKADMGHEGYGDISLLFDKETINPSDRRNKVYGGDAWTPRFPQMTAKINDKVSSKVRNKINGLIDNRALKDLYSLSAEMHPDNIERTISNKGVEGYYNNEWMKLAYLLDNGKKVKVPMKMKDYGDMSEIIISMAKERGLKVSDIQQGSFDFYQNNADFVDAVKKVVDERKLSSLPEEQRETLSKLLGEKEMKFSYFDALISAATRMEYDLEHGGLKQIIDRAALRETIEKKVKTNNADYNKWVDNLFEGIVEKYGIRNDRDWYTPSGNLRPWGQLYDDATPANILRHMLAENEQGGGGGFFDSNIMGASAESYGSIEEIREKGKKRLRRLEEGEYDEWSSSISDRMAEITDEFLSEKQKNDFGSAIDAKIDITNAVAKDKTAKGIYKAMKRDYSGFTMEQAKKVEEIVKEIQNFAIGYFEAKPRRIVPLNEVRKAIVPKNTSKDVLDGLKDNGIEVATYKKGDEAARARLIKKESDGIRFRVANQNQEIFVSNAQRSVEGIKQEKATPQQWLAMIEKNGGLKAGEDKWLGLSDWLKDSDKKSLTKAEILDFINQNKIVIEEVKYEEGDNVGFDEFGNNSYLNNIEDTFENLRVEYGPEEAFDKIVNAYPGIDQFVTLENSYLEWDIDEDELSDWINRDVRNKSKNNPINSTRLEYTTEGLENKQEIALVVPTIEPWNESDEVHFGDAGEGRAVAWIRFGETTTPNVAFINAREAVNNYIAEIREKYNVKGGGVYDVMNEEEVRHLQELTSAEFETRDNVERVLVIDEIQSKRHQEGREKGYKGSKTDLSILADARTAARIAYENYDSFLYQMARKYGFGNANEQHLSFDEWSHLENLKKKSDEAKENEKEVEKRYNLDGVPSAPFEKNWHELAMKRMLRYAAENGYDKVAWTTGEQQADRYNLSNVVERIQIKKYEDGYDVYSYAKGTGALIEHKTYSSEKELSDSYGQVLAAELIKKDAANKTANYVSVEGDGLKVGGEGMKGFYDKMLPSFVNKYVKKWGTKVQDIELPNVEESGRIMHSVNVTDDMKESVMEGQTMFRVVEKHREKVQEENHDDVMYRTDTDYLGVLENAYKENDKQLIQDAVTSIREALMNEEDISIGDLNWEMLVDYNGNNPKLLAAQYIVRAGYDIYLDDDIDPEYIKTGIKSVEPSEPSNDDMEEAAYTNSYLEKQIELSQEFKKKVKERQAYHEKGMWMWNGLMDKEQISSKYSSMKKEYEKLLEAKDYAKAADVLGELRAFHKGFRRYIKDSIVEIPDLIGLPEGIRFRKGKGALTEDEVSMVNDPVGKILGHSSRSERERKEFAVRERKRMVQRVKDLAKKLGLDNVEIVTNANELQGAQRKAKGFYSKSKRKITIVIPNHSSVFDAEQTLLHEAVGHYGLRELFGSHFNAFLNNVYQNASPEVRERINRLSMKNGWDFHKATEEYLSSLAEDTNFEDMQESWWSKIKHYFLQMLHEIGFTGFGGTTLTDNELRYILWRSYENLAEPGRYRSILGEAADIAMQDKLKVGNYSQSRYERERERLLATGRANSSVAESVVPYTQKEQIEDLVEEFASLYNSVPVHILDKNVSDEQLQEWTGMEDITTEELIDWMEEQKVPALHVRTNDNIIIFADKMKPEKVEKTLFHENLHKLFNHGAHKDLLDKFYESAKDDKNFSKWKDISDKYNESQRHEEFFVYVVSNKMKEGNLEEVLIHLSAKEQNELFDIINTIGYEYEQERHRRTSQAGRRGGRYSMRNSDVQRVGGGETQGKGSQEENGTNEAGQEGVEDDNLYRGSDEVEGMSDDTARRLYEKSVKGNAYRFQEGFQDAMLSLKKLQEAIVKQVGGKLEEWEDAYTAENQMSSRDTSEIENFMFNHFKPMIDAVAKFLKKSGMDYEALRTYLFAKSGLERNRDFAVRDAIARREKDGDDVSGIYEAYLQRKQELLKDLKDGAISFRTYCEEMDNEAMMIAPDLMGRDYSGLSSLFGEDTFTEDAIAEVEQVESLANTDALWNAIKGATQFSLDRAKQSGVMSTDVHKKLSEMFEWYIPMRGWSETKARDVYDYFGRQEGVFNPTIKNASGRKSLADDPLATIANMAESAIFQGNKNQMKQKLLNLAFDKPTNLITVMDSWIENKGTEDDPRWEYVYPPIEQDDDADVIADKIKQFEEEMEQKKDAGMAKKLRGRADVPYIATPNEIAEHIIRVKRNGREFVMILNGNPRAAQAINGATNPETYNGIIEQVSRRLNRFMAAAFTTKNPTFIMRNLSRDLIFSNTAVAIKESNAYGKKFRSNQMKVLGNMRGLMKRYQSGKLDMNNPLDKMFMEFIQNGGETGFAQLTSVDEYKNKIQRALKDAKNRGKKISVKKVGLAVMDTIEFYNRCAEDVSRFTVYMTSRQMGRSIQRSVSDAKEITVNFNKRGSGSKAGGFIGFGAQSMRSLYLFFNAAVQALVNFKRLGQKHPVAFTSALSMYAVSGFLMPVVNEFLSSILGGDDDDYENLPEWVRRNNLVISLGKWGGDAMFLTVPLPVEMRAFYGLGETANQLLAGNVRGKDAAIQITGQFAEMLPLNFVTDAAGPFNAFTPDAFKPIVQAYVANKDWTGKPIYRDNGFNKELPEWTKAYAGTSKWLVNSAELMNELTGGDKYKSGVVDINPARLEHLFTGYLGGFGDMFLGGYKTVSMLWNEDYRNVRNTPVLKAFLNQSDERTSYYQVKKDYASFKDEYEDTVRRLNGYERELKQPKTALEYAERMDFLQQSPQMKRYEVMKTYEKELNKLYQQMREIPDPEIQKAITTTINQIKSDAVTILREIK